MGLLCRGVDWKAADAVKRARVRDELARAVFPQCVRLFTCNRSELYAWDATVSDSRPALEHLFRVASGLESMILGEYQILGQVKEAYAQACAAGTVGKELDRIFRDAISCAKRVKTELDLGAVPPSVCRAGLELADERFGLADRRVFVIGSGRTGTMAVRLAVEKGAASIAACNRSPERAQHLVRDYGAKLVAYADRYAEIADSDIVISATASPHTVVECARLGSISRPMLFLDLAAPPDVEPAVAGLPGVSLIDLDAIAERTHGESDERHSLLAAGLGIVRSSVEKTLGWLGSVG